MLNTLAILLGIAVLVLGGELVVRSAGRLAIAAGVRPLVVGLTVIAFCTSAPELAASLSAANAGSPGLAVGNVLGSNIANIGLILGAAGLVKPLHVQSSILRRETPVMVGATLLLILMAGDQGLSRAEAAVLLLTLGGYLFFMVRAELRASEPGVETDVLESVGEKAPIGRDLGMVIVGVALLVGGAQALVYGAAGLARSFGVPEQLIGLTIMAVGTSLPELAASFSAAWRGQGDLVLGNVVGSNIFNILCILGVTGLVTPMPDGLVGFDRDLWVALGLALFLLPLLWYRRMIHRAEAAILLAVWGVYNWSIL